jgi:hypothetical protein
MHQNRFSRKIYVVESKYENFNSKIITRSVHKNFHELVWIYDAKNDEKVNQLVETTVFNASK